ncbi:MAG: alpha/beta fold hydrolase [Ardenticatenales bacterium]|nr:alpha/beta fold hydrolase [Ardenticatenales bacterium]
MLRDQWISVFDAISIHDYTIAIDDTIVVSVWGDRGSYWLHSLEPNGQLKPICPSVSTYQISPVACGSRIAFVAQAPEYNNFYRVHVYDFGDEKVVDLPVSPLPESRIRSLLWEDENHILTVDTDIAKSASLVRVHVGEEDPEQIAMLPGGEHWVDPHPAIRADGAILFVIGSAQGRQLMLLDPLKETAELLLRGNKSAEPLSACWSPCGERVLALVRRTRKLEAVLLDLSNGKMVVLKLPSLQGLPVWHPDGQRLVVTVDEWPMTRIAIHDLENQQLTYLPLPEGIMANNVQWHNDRCYFTAYSGNYPTSLWCWQGSNGEVLPVIGSKKVSGVSDPRVLVIPARTGNFDIPCLMYEPTNGDASSGTVLMLHGGPSTSWRIGWSPFVAALVLAGFRVVLVNTRGSAFTAWPLPTVSPGSFGESEMHDIGDCIEQLTCWGMIVPGRVAIMGHSYGAFIAYRATLCFPQQVAAAILTSGYLRPEDLLWSKDPQVREFYNYAFRDGVAQTDDKTVIHAPCPLLMVHGEYDFQIPAQVAVGNMNRLPGEQHQLLLLSGESHAFRRKDNVLDWTAEAIQFLCKHLPGR